MPTQTFFHFLSLFLIDVIFVIGCDLIFVVTFSHSLVCDLILFVTFSHSLVCDLIFVVLFSHTLNSDLILFVMFSHRLSCDLIFCCAVYIVWAPLLSRLALPTLTCCFTRWPTTLLTYNVTKHHTSSRIACPHRIYQPHLHPSHQDLVITASISTTPPHLHQ